MLLHGGVRIDEGGDGLVGKFVLEDDKSGALGARVPLEELLEALVLGDAQALGDLPVVGVLVPDDGGEAYRTEGRLVSGKRR